jgi:hypothetical protein
MIAGGVLSARLLHRNSTAVAARVRLGSPVMFQHTYFRAALAVFSAEVVIARFVHDDLVRPYLGDSLAVVLVYLALRTVAPLRLVPAVATAFAVACAIEIGQFFHLVDLLGLGTNRLARTVLGTTFGLADFAAYAGGALCVLAIEGVREAHGRSLRLEF